ncbi:molybdopterin-guanine dinucleotide biosynthesis protein B [Terrisporobacter mayombei]|uniref:Molybdopterin-guanine dinucleotide biosynthesis adapter protein n=1 Tax=Terrisporobacter mayombei TaxID=1541 RepID=A0ABY9Q440_9FIRM|nr:molybdopterin-guanine dinucleotide biosynthesis protein B [Terrisporobacter mayombei]MCC3869118.1 molybdopterin-guanine dinucleotide biosynthesis protein B [Terrisporobacter mayombei]WMT82747.1 Molybdopterin-guanine dinucleotide biosynthesis adapter protein [Terrisporobacter mayombei]
MTKRPFLMAISGCKNSGKTTLITKLIPKFCEKGYKIATIKHDGHDFKCDVVGTDTYKHKNAGAYGTAIFSNNKFMVIKEEKFIDETYFIKLFPEADIIFLEGFKSSDYPKLEIVRKGNSNRPICNEKNLIGILSDINVVEGNYNMIDLNNIDLIVEKILNYMKNYE